MQVQAVRLAAVVGKAARHAAFAAAFWLTRLGAVARKVAHLMEHWMSLQKKGIQ
jgi:hypothetical protein